MEERRVTEFSIDVFADRANVKDVVTGVLHTIFWYRIFANLPPKYQEILEVALPTVQDVDLQTLIEQRVDGLVRQLEADSSEQNPGGRGHMVVHFSERRRRKGWFGAKGDEDLIWETWTLNVVLASPRTQQGEMLSPFRAEAGPGGLTDADIANTRRAMETSLNNAGLKITNLAQQHKDHVPPITTSPFPRAIRLRCQHSSVHHQSDPLLQATVALAASHSWPSTPLSTVARADSYD